MKTLFITGVSSGLGHGLAETYLKEGYTVYGLSRRPTEDLTSFKNFHFKSIDLENFDALQGQVEALLQDVPSLDLVILNAGILGKIQDMADLNLSSIRQIMDINVWANKLICDALFKKRIAIDQVIAISSGASVNGNRGWGGYALSKATLNMLVQLYAREQESCHFSSLAPGLVDTAMQDYLCSEPDEEHFPSVKKLRHARGTEKMPSPEELSQKILSLVPKLKELPSGSFADIRKLLF